MTTGCGKSPSQAKTSALDGVLTMSEIAKAAGVSVMTVSRVLNGRPDVATATRERIQRVVAERGYARNRAAAALRSGRSGLIDLVVVTLDSAYHLEIIRGVEERLESTGFRMALSATHGQAQGERQWLAKVIDGSTDGAILVLADGHAAHLERLRQRGIPFVVVDHRGELGSDTPSVGATNWAGGRAATEYLLTLGHRRVAIISGTAALGCSQERLSGYRAALEAAGLPVDPSLCRQGDFRYEDGYREACALLDLPEPPTAIFAGNDMQAVGALNALRARGISVPADMSIVGFDDVEIATLVTPALTTIRQPLAQMGAFAAAMLLLLIAGEPLGSNRVELATELVVRESCAAPRPA
jgi:LacI family transcriptional regulator